MLSVFVITLNEEKNLARCLQSVSWADEIILVDSGSTDRTIEIGKKYTNQISLRPFTNYSEQKNYALSLTHNDWVLSVDADEEITDELAREIDAAVTKKSSFSAYRIRRHSVIFGRTFHFTGTQDDMPIRLFRRTKGLFKQPIHESIEVQGSVGSLKGIINHFTYRSIADYINKLNRYTSMEAALMTSRSAVAQKPGFFAKPFLMFCRLFFWKQGFRDGLQGFLFSLFSAYYVFLKRAKYWEKRCA